MRTSLAIAGMIALALSTAVSSATVQQNWTPTLEVVSKLEGKERSSWRLPKPLEQAQRTYGGYYKGEHRIVFGQYIWSGGPTWKGHPGIELSPNGAIGGVEDGGCSVFNVWYDVDAGIIFQDGCNGRA